jgi:hypothetical protein
MKHIEHLEDYFLKRGTKATNTLLETIQSGNAEITVKYDGAPAIVFGHDAIGPFISTKSYFNKTPLKYYSHDQLIADISDLQLLKKLTAAFSAIKHNPPEYLNTYQGDLLYWDGNVDMDRRFQPNIVEYWDSKRAINPKQKVGIALHTQLEGDVPYENDRIWFPPLKVKEYGAPQLGMQRNFYVDNDLEKINANIGDDFLIKIINQHIRNGRDWRLSRTVATNYIQASSAKEVEKLKTREAKERSFQKHLHWMSVTDHVSFGAIEKAVQELRTQKAWLFQALNEEAQQLLKAKIGEEWAHEGFVAKTPHGTVKIVLRELFSAMNFDPNAQRGWSLAK